MTPRWFPPLVLLVLLTLPGPAPGVFAAPPQPVVQAPQIVAGTTKEEIPDWLARWELARVLTYTGRYEEALREYRRVRQAQPGRVEAQVETAHVLYLLQRPAEALRELEAADPARLPAPARLLLAELYTQEKRYDEAERLLTAHLEKHPGDAQARLRLANILSWTKRYPAALQAFERILADHPGDLQVRRQYALVLSWAGRHADAARELRKTLPD